MSGSGGFFKYRCKNFYSHNCPNWVWVNHSPCATCLAEGKDNEAQAQALSLSFSLSPCPSRDYVFSPTRHGISQDTMMEVDEFPGGVDLETYEDLEDEDV